MSDSPETAAVSFYLTDAVPLACPYPGCRSAIAPHQTPHLIEAAYIERRLSEARAAAVAPLERALRACIAGFDEWDAERGRAPLPGIPERWWQASEAARRLLSAPSPVREPEGLDVERLARQFHEMLKAFRYPGCGWQFASEVEDGSPLCPCPGVAAKYVAYLAATPGAACR